MISRAQRICAIRLARCSVSGGGFEAKSRIWRNRSRRNCGSLACGVFRKKKLKWRGCGAVENQRLVLKKVARVEESANGAYAALYDAPESAAAQVRIALKKAEELAKIDASVAPVLEVLKTAAIGINEASDTLRDYLDRLEADPERLDQTESRLALIDRLKRKYGASLAEVLAFLDDVRAQLAAVETAGERKAALEQELARASEAYQSGAAERS